MALTVHEHKFDPTRDTFDKKLLGILDYFSLSYDSADDSQKDKMLEILNETESRLLVIDAQIYSGDDK